MWREARAYDRIHAKAGRQLGIISSLLPPCGSLETSGRQAWQRVPLPAEPSCHHPQPNLHKAFLRRYNLPRVKHKTKLEAIQIFFPMLFSRSLKHPGFKSGHAISELILPAVPWHHIVSPLSVCINADLCMKTVLFTHHSQL